MEAGDIEFPLNDPPFMIRDIESDKRYFKVLMKDNILSKIKNTLGMKVSPIK